MRKIAVLLALFALVVVPAGADAKGFKGCAKPSASCCPKNENAASKNDSAVYRVSFTKSGGIAGVHKSYTLESNKLEKAEQATLSDLLQKSGILSISSVTKTTRGAADMFQYQLTVEHKGKTHTASYDDGTLPQAYRPLFDYVTKNASPPPTISRFVPILQSKLQG